MTPTAVRLGYIGAGACSRRVLLPNYQKLPGVELVAVANSSRKSSDAVANEFGFTRSAANWREVVDADDIDAIVVGTRTEVHYEMIVPVLEAGRHVLSMNALCRNTTQARELTARAAGHPGLVALVYPAADAAYFLREDAMMRHLLDDGYVVAYAGARNAPASFFGARRGSRELELLPIPPEFDHGVSVEADFIAAIRGEHEPARAIPRFEDAMRLLRFGEAWRESSEKSGWCDLI